MKCKKKDFNFNNIVFKSFYRAIKNVKFWNKFCVDLLLHFSAIPRKMT